MEWERRLIKKKFQVALKDVDSAVRGAPLSLQLSQLSTTLLEQVLQHASTFLEQQHHQQHHHQQQQEASSVKAVDDDEMKAYTIMAEGLIKIRSQLRAMSNAYHRRCKFTPTNLMETILRSSMFLPDAIDQAIAMTSSLHPNNNSNTNNNIAGGAVVAGAMMTTMRPSMVSEWSAVEELIMSLRESPRGVVDIIQREVQLLYEETLARKYVADVMSAFQRIKSCIGTPSMQSDLCDDVYKLYSSYYSTSHSIATGGCSCSKVLDFLNKSVVILVHYLRASSLNLYDSHERGWSNVDSLHSGSSLSILTVNITAGRYTMQHLLRSVAKESCHATVRVLITFTAHLIDTAVSCKELREYLTNKQYVSRFDNKLQAVIAPSDSEAYAVDVMDRIERITQKYAASSSSSCFKNFLPTFIAQEAEFMELCRTFTVVRQLRGCHHGRKYSELLSILDDFLGDGQRSLPLVLESIFKCKYSVHAVALDEFRTLCCQSCNILWQNHVTDILSDGSIRGYRGALNASEISWALIDASITLLAFIDEPSQGSLVIKAFLDHVRNMRRSSVQYPNATTRPSSSDDLQQIDALIDTVRNSIDSIPIVDTVKSHIRCECDLLSSHTQHLRKGFFLEAAIETIQVGFDELGLVVRCDDISIVLQAHDDAVHQQWLLDKSSLEYSWSTLTIVTELFLKFMEILGIGNISAVASIHPGTKKYSTVVKFLLSILSRVDTFTADTESNAGLQQQSLQGCSLLSKSVLDACSCFRAANLEHSLLHDLDLMVPSDRVVALFEEERMMIRLDHVSDVSCGGTMFTPSKGSSEGYVEYVQSIQRYLKAISVKTSLGALLIELLGLLFDFRIAVFQQDWSTASSLGTMIHWIDEFPSRGEEDIAIFRSFFEYYSMRRALEYAIVRCDTPNYIGWTLLVDSDALINPSPSNNDDGDALEVLLDKYRSDKDFKGKCEKHVILRELDALGQKV